MDSEVWKFILGGGGGVGLIAAVLTFLRDRRRDRVLDEDTALKRLHDDYERKKAEAAKGWRLVQWFRHHYSLLWTEYMRTPDAEKDKFPPTPPSDIDY